MLKLFTADVDMRWRHDTGRPRTRHLGESPLNLRRIDEALNADSGVRILHRGREASKHPDG
jgi:hypothetical protein